MLVILVSLGPLSFLYICNVTKLGLVIWVLQIHQLYHTVYKMYDL